MFIRNPADLVKYLYVEEFDKSVHFVSKSWADVERKINLHCSCDTKFELGQFIRELGSGFC